jgi:hypothetical protein
MKKWPKRNKDENPKEPEKGNSPVPKKVTTKTVRPQQERPRICLIDVDKAIVQELKNRGFYCQEGTLGRVVNVPNANPDNYVFCLANYEFPPNLHEYDIVIVDLQNPISIPYDIKDHSRSQIKGNSQTVFISSYPETVFDPRAASASIFQSYLEYLMEKKSILIVFAAANETSKYNLVSLTSSGLQPENSISCSIYDFYADFPNNDNMAGADTRVVLDNDSELCALLKRHNRDAKYAITFSHPKDRATDGEYKESAKFIPLMEGRPNNIVSFAHFREENCTFVFPYIKEKGIFLVDLLEKVLPGIIPDVFPFSTQFAWLSDPEYRLPNEENLFDEKEKLRVEFNLNMEILQQKIATNRQEYEYIHDLLTQSGTELVKTVEKYLRWLGFDNVINVDETKPELKEEDLRVENKKGLLVIEVKGIGGTSTDAECSQVSKFRFRRAKERGKVDVSALYMVNHQRYLPPGSRINPPFSEHQIQDAVEDERGLITTYDLFKLYFNIENDFISKEDARIALFQKGLVEFRPSKAIQIPSPTLKYNGTVIIFNADGLEDIFVGMEVLLDNRDRYRVSKILEIQIDGKFVERANSGMIGIKISESAKKGTNLWIRSNK